tara:strand:+ start:620 stop:778 length:159 start_codon:yes stop_codon:yes gene_type:complete
MTNIVNLPLAQEKIEWVAAIRVIEAALIEYSESVSEDDAVALQRAWDRIRQG